MYTVLTSYGQKRGSKFNQYVIKISWYYSFTKPQQNLCTSISNTLVKDLHVHKS